MAEIASAYVTLIPSLKGAKGRIARELGGEGQRAGKAFQSAFSGSGLSGFAKHATGVALMASKIGALTSVAGSAAPALAAVVAGLAPLGGAVAVLPGAAMAAAGAFGALKVGTAGFADALAAVGDPAAFSQKIASLAPNARAAAVAIQGVASGWSQMRTQVQDNLFAGVAQQIAPLSSALLPQVSAGLNANATAWNKVALEAMKAVTEQAKMGGLGQMLAAPAASIQRLSAAVGPLVNGIFNLVRGSQQAAGSLNLIRVDGLIAAAQHFEAWTARISADGTIQRWVANAQIAFGQVSLVLSSVGSIVSGVFSAMQQAGIQGGASLSVLGAGLQTIATIVNSPAFQTGLISFFQGAQTGMAGLTAALPAVTTALGGIAGVAGQLAATLGPVLGVALTAIANTITALLPGVQGLIAGLGPGLMAVVSALAPVLVQLGATLSPVIAMIGQALGQALVAVAPLLRQLGILVVAAAQAIAPMAAAVLPLLVDAFTVVVGVISNVVGAVIPGLITAFGGISTAVQGVVALVRAIFSGDWAAAWEAMKQVASGAMTALGGILSAAWEGIKVIFSAAWEAIKAAAGLAWDALKSAASAAMDALGNAVSSGIDSAVNFFTALPGRITSALSGLAGDLRGVGVEAARGLLNGLESMAGAISDKARNMARSAVDAAKSALRIHSPSRVFMGIGAYTAEGLAVGIERNAKDAVRASAGMADAVTSAATTSASMTSRVRTVSPLVGTAPAGDAALAASLDAFGAALLSQPIILKTNDREFARATRRGAVEMGQRFR